MNLIDFNMDIQDALAAPRISFLEPDILAVEDTVPQKIIIQLKAKGHNVRTVTALGNAHGLTIAYDKDGLILRFKGAADPRGQGKDDRVIRRGDCLWTDFCLDYLGLKTDINGQAYVCRLHETEPPPGIQSALKRAHRVQEIYMQEFAVGRRIFISSANQRISF